MKNTHENALIQSNSFTLLDPELLDMEGDVSDAYLAEVTRRVSLAHDQPSQENTVYDWLN